MKNLWKKQKKECKIHFMTLIQAEQSRLMIRASRASVIVAGVLIAVKTIVFALTGSVAILSALFDSIQDSVTSLVSMIAVRQAVEPADKNHRFGHGKAQAIGSFIQAIIISVATVLLAIESVRRLIDPQPVRHMGMGIGATVLAIVLSIGLVRYQTRVIKQTGALSIKADRAHYTGDIWMNIGVIISMEIAHLTGWTGWDALFGIGVAIYLGFSVAFIIRESVAMLMDAEMPKAFRSQIKAVAYSFPDVLAVHDLKTRQSGNKAFVQFCVHMDDRLTLRQAHQITEEMEHKISERFPDTEVIIHPEPERKKV